MGSGKLVTMKYTWTPERIAALEKVELKNLHQNAVQRGNLEIATLCESELNRRPSTGRAPKGNASDLRTKETRRMEANAAEMLASVAADLTKRFDLSPALAKALSEGSKQFRAHSLTDKAGRAKVGGAQRQGKVIFDRYISYRIREDVCALTVMMFADDVETPHYQVVGSERLIDHSTPTLELRPFIADGELSSLTPVGREFPDFAEATKFFVSIIERLTDQYPRLKNV